MNSYRAKKAIHFLNEQPSQRNQMVHSTIGKYVLSLVLLVLALSAEAQYIYFGTGLGYEATPYRINYDAATVHNSFNWNISAMWRPLRNLGVGVTIGIPIYQGTRFSFGDSPTPDGSSFYNFRSTSSDSRIRYKPQEYDYDFVYGTSYTLNLRYFFAVQPDFYLDLNFTKLTITEQFKMKTPSKPTQYENINYTIQYGYVQAVDIDYSRGHDLLIPGVGIGYMPNIAEHLKLDFYFGIGFLNFKEDPFVFQVAHDWDIVNDKTEYVDLTGQTEGLKTVLNFNVGLNYIF